MTSHQNPVATSRTGVVMDSFFHRGSSPSVSGQRVPILIRLTRRFNGLTVSEVSPSVRLGPARRIEFTLRHPLLRRGQRIAVPKKNEPLWYEKGWRKEGGTNRYKGRYTAAGRTWQGEIEEPYPGGIVVYIWNPPLDQIRRYTGKGPCFSPSGTNGRYQVHYHRVPTSLDHAITNVEAVLSQACKNRAY